MDYNTFIRRDLALLLYEYSIFNSLLKFHSSFYVYTLLTRWKKKKSFIFIYLSPDLIFLFLLFIYIQFVQFYSSFSFPGLVDRKGSYHGAVNTIY